ncbi:MAG: thioredoxin domain-containing protein [Eubacteriales bacterium]|nr:thioredoxin domain-containing protein [Eubacteriales bacterium]
MSNRLKNEKSPYLLQHADNPVDWYPWGEEAFEKARREDKPVFLSIGYSTCHWCHVMAHESFENEEIAGILNQYFVAVKVDREERPDIDSVYMAVCQAMTGNGGWPMSIFMTPDQKPFYACTYVPPAARYGMMGFRELLLVVEDRWKNKRPQLLESADLILDHLTSENSQGEGNIDTDLPRQAANLFAQSFDKQYGGFGNAPKFPTPHNLIFLTLYSVLYHEKNAFEQVKVTLKKMRRGGIFDQIGYGFSRYSTDRYFLVPHFEKMLYDNALLILAYAIAYQVSGERMFLDTAEKTAAYVFREMTGPQGEFYSAQDADSEGQEGRFYFWEYKEVMQVLGEEAGKKFCCQFGIVEDGVFEGKNIPNLLSGNAISDEFEQERKTLYEYRKSRAPLHLDDKVLTAWNSLMICALAVLYRVTGNNRYLLAAEKNQQFIERYLVKENLLYVSCRDQKRSVNGFLDDYAYYGAALLCLYQASSKEVYLQRARDILEETRQQFADKKNGGYFLYGTKNDSLITKPKETYDGAMPSGNSVMAYNLVRFSQLEESMENNRRAQQQLAFLSEEAKKYPAGYTLFQTALLLYLYPPEKITVVLAGEEPEKVLVSLPLYADVRILTEPTDEYALINGKTTYYVCKDYTCLPPSNEMPC